jgi:prepilin-type N-terminal cleavage/methylation domain-containing protein
MKRAMTRSNGFTLIELLVVVGITTVLASILLPAAARVRDAAMGTGCQANVHTLMAGMIAFSMDNEGHFPGTLYGSNDGSYAQSDWLFGRGNFNSAPQSGTLWQYVKSTKAYRCPSLETIAVGDSAQSNGRFDYAMFVAFAGAPIHSICLRSNLTLLTGGCGYCPTPIICQEDPYQFNNTNIEGDHANVDQMTHIHGGGSYYGSVDGSVNWVNEPDVVRTWANGCWQWSCQGPRSHNQVQLGGDGGWDWWSTQ